MKFRKGVTRAEISNAIDNYVNGSLGKIKFAKFYVNFLGISLEPARLYGYFKKLFIGTDSLLGLRLTSLRVIRVKLVSYILY